MADDVYQGPSPGGISVLSAEHGELVKCLYDLRGRLKEITHDVETLVERY
jgi:hypothetical protein